MAVVRHVASDILTDLKQMYDDAKIEMTQVVYWMLVFGNEMRAKAIQSKSSGAFLSTFTPVTVEVDAVTKRKYVELPGNIYDFNNDRGIDYIAYDSKGEANCPPRFTRVHFIRTSPAVSYRLYMTDYENPSPKNPYFYRVHNRLYFLGLEMATISAVELGLHMALDPITSIDIDGEFDFPEEMIAQIKRRILDMGRFVLMIPQERTNDGAAEMMGGQKIPTNKIVSVNEQAQDNQQ